MRGDVVTFNKPYSETLDDAVLRGVCKKTNRACEVPRDRVYVMATSEEPTEPMMVR
jgi:hypothetical protein